jgi:hypothetical protein
MGIVRDLYYARKMSAGLKLPAPTVALLIKRLRLAAAMGGGVTKTVSGSPAHITDALAKAALSVLASIEPIQDLHGYATPWPAGGGKNKCVPDLANGQIGSNGGYSSSTSRLTNTVKIDDVYLSNTYLSAGTYTLSSDGLTQCTVLTKDASGQTIDNFATAWHNLPYTFTMTAAGYVLFTVRKNSGDLNPDDYKAQIESGSTATSWEPYENICPISGRTWLSVYVGPTQDQQDATTYAFDWTSEAGTVYGGTLDVVTGVLTVDRASISSYAGETLPGAWISDRDVYAPGTSPTTGAQVVYDLATPLTYQLSAQEVQMLLGENYVWSSSGDTVSVTYYAEGNANPLQSLNILLGGNYSNPKTADDVSDKEALEIILGGNK